MTADERRDARIAEINRMVRGKLVAENVGDLTDATLEEKLSPCAGANLCLWSARKQVAEGLTIHMLYMEFPVYIL